MTSSNKDPRNETGVDLGFLEAIGTSDEWQLESRFFPSKLGGKPSWLDLKDLPPTSQIECPTCNTPRSFLCQIYANIDDFTACFHRTLFVFMCRTVSSVIATLNIKELTGRPVIKRNARIQKGFQLHWTMSRSIRLYSLLGKL